MVTTRRKAIVLFFLSAVLTIVGLWWGIPSKEGFPWASGFWFPIPLLILNFVRNPMIALFVAMVQFPVLAYVWLRLERRKGVIVSLLVVAGAHLAISALALSFFWLAQK